MQKSKVKDCGLFHVFVLTYHKGSLALLLNTSMDPQNQVHFFYIYIFEANL